MLMAVQVVSSVFAGASIDASQDDPDLWSLTSVPSHVRSKSMHAETRDICCFLSEVSGLLPEVLEGVAHCAWHSTPRTFVTRV